MPLFLFLIIFIPIVVGQFKKTPNSGGLCPLLSQVANGIIQ